MHSRAIIATLALLVAAGTVHATDVSGPQFGTWTLANSPYVLVGDVTVPAGERLTIEPGVVVRGRGLFKLVVNGELQAVGTAGQPILMTAEVPATGWRGMKFERAADISRLEYCIVEYAKGTGAYPEVRGGGVIILECSPTVAYCELRYNYSHNGNYNGVGGGILTETSNARIRHNYIHHNEADSGAGICCTEYGTPVLADNRITDNTAFYAGGGIYMGARSSPLVERNVILRNAAGGWGGGGINSWTSFIFYGTFPTIRDNVIAKNVSTSGGAAQGGGGIYCRYDKAVISNNTIADNQAVQGGGIYVVCYPAQAPEVTSSIIWGNTASAAPQIGLEASTGAEIWVNYSDVQGGWTGTGNLDLPPAFVNPAGDDYHLTGGSPCINTGDPAHFAPAERDIDGQIRDWNTPGGAPRLVDMGADEFGAAVPGDCNCDGRVNFDDINWFVLALTDPAGYGTALPTCNPITADVNSDGVVNFDDINPFVAALSG
ncbi:MAG: right-handed parallel beta-helix repeat-containing protein [Planctomycetota bacterium]